jgi:23S rRNA (cytidine1920-2'-O)/16S rRNA (cytidine1409-2'-O)-methyltransferase
VLAAAVELGWQARGLVGSPITGPAGNHEYLLWLVSAPGGLKTGEGTPGGWDTARIQEVIAATLER